jgi:hypothetical protein
MISRISGWSLFLFLMVLGPAAAFAQISPGELSTVHAALEGVDNCTSCHALGRNIDNEKCLACHTEIADRITRRTGFHGGLSSHKCVECHKEHHGRAFSIVRFDTTGFDHNRVGFTLVGKHARAACVACHRPANLRDERIRGNAARVKAGTFLGLGRECLACHKDQHGGQFNKACTTCHGQEAWKPLAVFSHDGTRFPLTGKHQTVECGKCHRAPSPGSIVAYTGMKFASCTACHADPHAGKFKKPCESCHTTAGWRAGAAAHFDHSTTRFLLRGKHAEISCDRCHRGKENGAARFVIRQFGKCADCHTDPHRGKFVPAGVTKACEQCHVETGWKDGQAKVFDHGQTRFALRDAHKSAACTKCHGSETQPGLRASLTQRPGAYACEDCHVDAHRGQFTASGKTKCERCHTERAFMPPAFGITEHQRSGFPLSGAHGAVPCVECHKKAPVGGTVVRQFRWGRPQVCKDCHTDPHRGAFDKFVQQGCADCHTSQAWSEASFAHDRTAFKLTGKHAGVACYRCHGPGGSDAPLAQWRFGGTPKNCVDCHGQNVRPL